MKKPLLVFLVIALCSLAIDLGTFWLRGYNFYYCSLVTYVLYFFFTLGCCRQWRQIAPAKILLAVIAGWCLPYLPLIVFGDLHPAAPIDLTMHVLGMAAGYLFFKARRTGLKIAVVVASVALLALEPTFIRTACRYDSFGNVSGRVTPAEQIEPIRASGIDGGTVLLGDDPSKVYVIDCWNMGCGFCLEKMPEFQQLYERYRENDRIVFCALNIRDTPEAVRRLFEKEGISVPAAICERETALRLGVKAVPTYLIVADGKIVYRNGSDPLEKQLGKLLREE